MSWVSTVALALDRFIGEVPVLHPVRGMGRLLQVRRERDRRLRRHHSSAAGAAAVLQGAALSAGAGATVAAGLDRIRPPWSVVAGGLALSQAISLRELLAAGARVRAALEQGRLEEARSLVGRDLVGRPTAELSRTGVASATIESLAENFSDGVVAPLFWFEVGGLPGSYAYRFVETADSMLGHRTPELRDYGRPAARLDDAANLIPARLAAALLVGAARGTSGSSRRALRIWLRDGARTASPNGGRPMAAMAGALGVRLEKDGHHILNPEGRPPDPSDVARACALVERASLRAGMVAGTISFLRSRRTGRGRRSQ